jgi:NADH-quinone oxidoreductase subunit B
MEVVRHSNPAAGLEPREPSDFRIRQLRARDLLAGDLEGAELEKHVQESIITTTLDKAVAWGRGNALFPATFGLACCAIEMMSIVASRVDVARFGFEAFRASPRQADLLILSGRVSIKMAPVVRRIWDQMLEPKWAIAMGACSSSMGVFNNYAIVPADKFMPVAVHVPGCPPRPEALMHGILKLRQQIVTGPDQGWRERYQAIGTEEIIRLESGPAHPGSGTPGAIEGPAAGGSIQGHGNA